MATFSEYFKTSGRTRTDLARDLGISYSYLCDLVRGECFPSVNLALKIQRETGGFIPVEYWAAEADMPPLNRSA